MAIEPPGKRFIKWITVSVDITRIFDWPIGPSVSADAVFSLAMTSSILYFPPDSARIHCCISPCSGVAMAACQVIIGFVISRKLAVIHPKSERDFPFCRVG